MQSEQLTYSVRAAKSGAPRELYNGPDRKAAEREYSKAKGKMRSGYLALASFDQSSGSTKLLRERLKRERRRASA